LFENTDSDRLIEIQTYDNESPIEQVNLMTPSINAVRASLQCSELNRIPHNGLSAAFSRGSSRAYILCFHHEVTHAQNDSTRVFWYADRIVNLPTNTLQHISPPINRHLWRSGGARQVGLADAGGRAGPTDRRDRPAGPLTITAFIRRGAGRALRAGVSAQQVGSRRVPSKKRACYDEVTWSIPVATWTDMERTQRCLPPPAIERRQTSHRWRTARAPSAA